MLAPRALSCSALWKEVRATETTTIHRDDAAVTLRDEVERMVSTAIVTGELGAGTLITVPSLAAQFAVSATPVREAMVNLQKRGFLSPVRNKGFRVTEVSDRDLREVAVLRAWIEAPAMAEIAAIFPRDRVSEFRTLADQIVRAVDEGDLGGHVEADVAFHDRVLGLLGNKTLLEVIATLRQRSRQVGLAAQLDSPEMRRSASEHHLILDRLMDGDGPGVAELVRAHILDGVPLADDPALDAGAGAPPDAAAKEEPQSAEGISPSTSA
ncbi:GntR family transcriptional regulator [Microbacterium sp. S308A+]|uniref:GntR family transcriptional regulator n=1 Tax=Microbacterium sp. S308A+ TaxID=3415135 RepID=UPI003C7DE118